ncbi:MAG TPA: phospholipase D-like domain-containing protein [Anaeromyxobacter sp.]|nr:phospholipase D-like domain-containing protein [Anaeromyxobacter sp.]
MGPVLAYPWKLAGSVLAVLVAVLAAGHVVLHKRDVRAALGWIGLIAFAPLVGAAAYVVFGVNRIRRRAQALRPPEVRPRPGGWPPAPPLPTGAEHLTPLIRLSDAVVRRPLVAGNRVELLPGGGRAYPAMLAAVEAARRSITLCTYIFDTGRVGETFVEALAAARARGVEVRVLIDAIGVRYHWPPVHWRLRRQGVRTALFLPRLSPVWLPFVNLRNHRKILVVDGRIGFTGGMNIRDRFMPSPGGPAPFADLQARLEGPVVAHLQSAFAEDWLFTTGEELFGPTFFPPPVSAGPVLARGIPDGPDEDFETIRWVLLGAIAESRSRIRIVTPYFLPDQPLITALNVAAMRGIEVDIVLPERGNLPIVQWAQNAQLWQVLDHGCRVWLSPRPFDHSKAMTVDGAWSLLGSANWDPRSLRLNFELDVEAFDTGVAADLDALIDGRLAAARPLTLGDVDERPLPLRLRDGLARLLSPYL